MVGKVLLAVTGFAAGTVVAVTLSARRQLLAERARGGLPVASAEGAADDRAGATAD